MSETKHTPELSIVIPVYYNEGSLLMLFNNIEREIIAVRNRAYVEVIFVDDGSGDNSYQELEKLYEQNSDVISVIRLTRNFGQVNAMIAGFQKATGKNVAAMSADGQDPVSIINDMYAARKEKNVDVVIAQREGRDESLYRVLTSRFFYALMQRLTFSNMPKGGFDFVLLSRRALESFLRNIDARPFVQGQILWMGYACHFIGYHRGQRTAGISRWTFWKKLTYLIDGTLAFSYVPIRLMSLLGIVCASVGFLYALVVVCVYIFEGNPVKGWAPIIVIMLTVGGFQMIMLGMIGEYVWRTLEQARGREHYIINKMLTKRECVHEQ